MAISERKQVDLLIKAILNCIAEWKTSNPDKNEPIWVARGTTVDEIEWQSGTPLNDEIETEFDRLKVEWTAQEYARNRQAEYPSIEELVVALYDTDDKSAIEAKRAEVKKKYPKP